MLYSTGIDIIEIERVAAAIERHGSKFIRRAFTGPEIDYCSAKKQPARHFAVRFAAKEAVFKSLKCARGTPLRWREIEIVTDADGLPDIVLYGETLKTQRERGISRIAISLTHSKNTAAAVAIAIGAGAD